MIRLVPLEETVAAQELMKKGYEEGWREGLQKAQEMLLEIGDLIGHIRFAQRMLHDPVSSTKGLSKFRINVLKAIWRELERDLVNAKLLEGTTLSEDEA